MTLVSVDFVPMTQKECGLIIDRTKVWFTGKWLKPILATLFLN